MLKGTTLWLETMFRLPITWWQRAGFRTQLRADLKERADLLHDLGFNLADAQAEARRFFWESVVLTRQPFPSDAVEENCPDRRVDHETTSLQYSEAQHSDVQRFEANVRTRQLVLDGATLHRTGV